MPTTTLSAVRIGEVTQVSVATDLVGVVAYHWYLDGSYLGATTETLKSFFLAKGQQARIECVPTDDADYDPYAAAQHPASRLLFWVRSIDEVEYYRIDQRVNGGDWQVLRIVYPQPGDWSFRHFTEALQDLAEYSWRIVPVDQAGNDGTPIVVGPEMIVRVPEAPSVTAEFDPETLTVTVDRGP
jgi:hypothetical protein